jgi:plasmid stability protein
MASLTIRDLDDDLKEKLRVRAAQHGHSMEEEARVILRRAVEGVSGPELWEASRKLFGAERGVDLDLPPRVQDRPPPQFDAPRRKK